MAGGQERILRRRIRSVQSTMKITRAQELIAASRIVRAQRAIEAARPYVAKMAEVVAHLVDTPEGQAHPLLRRHDDSGQRAAVLTITADRGFAGAYNTSVLRAAEQVVRDHRSAGREVSLVSVGRKGESYFRFRREELAASITGVSDRPSYEDARGVVGTILQPLADGELGSVQIVYTRFLSAGSQVVSVRQLLPIEGEIDGTVSGTPRAPGELPTVYEFEPDPAEILDRLIPSWIESEVLAAMLDASASEHAARQRAMAAATENAEELIKNLVRVMNRARQDSITTEIMEIVGGAEALREGQAAETNFTETYEEHTA
ncbi:MAG: F0F1 ATP synthase subunit gamma [Acidimicrobiaceae bacterium]|nr:F0F1 ATP synthase subunit gamma [Acidimicrobiaceae bacterium]